MNLNNKICPNCNKKTLEVSYYKEDYICSHCNHSDKINNLTENSVSLRLSHKIAHENSKIISLNELEDKLEFTVQKNHFNNTQSESRVFRKGQKPKVTYYIDIITDKICKKEE